jgi:hypothetical protein
MGLHNCYSSVIETQPEITMSELAKDLIELNKMVLAGADTVTQAFRNEVAARLISAGVRNEQIGC